jgi:PAS domain S-box-containing protein
MRKAEPLRQTRDFWETESQMYDRSWRSLDDLTFESPRNVARWRSHPDPRQEDLKNMIEGRLSSLRRYTIGMLLTLLALSLGLLGAGMWGAAATYSLFLGAVMITSWISGLGPGLLATVLGTIAADYFLLAPIHTLTFDVSRVVQLSAFVGVAILISSLNNSRWQAFLALAAAREQLEMRVTERTAELAKTNDDLRAEIERGSRTERMFRRLIDAAPDAILVINSDGCIININDEAERLFGYPRETLLGRDVEVIIPQRFKAAHRAKRATYGEASSTRTISGDLAARRADGTEVPVEIRVSPLDSEGQLTIVGIVRDVTRRQRAQMEQQRLVHELGERVKELTALHEAGRLLNEPARPGDLLPQIVELLPRAWQYPDIASARITAGGVEAATAGFRLTPWLQRAEFPIAGDQTGAIEVVYREPRSAAAEGPFLAEERRLIESLAAMLEAYFERLQAEDQRLDLARSEAARRRAQEDNAAKDQFLSTLSHELRSPLTVMLGWITMLRSGQMSGESSGRAFGVLERNVRLQAKLIDELLDVSRIIAGKLRIERHRVDLAVVAGNVVEAARPAARAKHIELTAEITPSMWMEADPQRLQQIVSNLLTNALKFTPPQGSIQLRVERIGDRAQVVVHDTGIGIHEDLLPRIFERFQQGATSTPPMQSGLGLGLAIVKHLVEQHGGQITAASKGAGCGSTFTITFPLLRTEVAAPDRSPSSTVDRMLLSGVNVLVIEDEPDTRATLEAVLEQYGAHPTVVANAREALSVVRERPPDVLLSDIVMPGEDGYALIRHIRATVDATQLPAVALSGHLDKNAEATAVDAGFQAFLTKPIDPTSLAQALARLIHRGSIA